MELQDKWNFMKSILSQVLTRLDIIKSMLSWKIEEDNRKKQFSHLHTKGERDALRLYFKFHAVNNADLFFVLLLALVTDRSAMLIHSLDVSQLIVFIFLC